MAKILSISSEVLAGAVGNTLARPVLKAAGHEVFALPTVVFAAHPGHGPSTPVVTAPEGLTHLLEGLESLGRLQGLSAVLTGYFAAEEQVKRTATWIQKLKTANPNLTYICDPIIGDGDALYVQREIADAIREDLLPLADVATPNRFELEWLSGSPCNTKEDALAAARKLGPDLVAVTSAIKSEKELTSLLVTREEVAEETTRHLDDVPHGSGDLFTALFVSELLNGTSPAKAFHTSTQRTFETCRGNAGNSDLEV